MLENLLKPLKKAAIPAAVFLSSLFPSKALSSYISFVNIGDKAYTVEIDNKTIEVNAETDDIGKKASKKALVNQKTEELGLHIHNLEYEVIEMLKEPLKDAKTTANKINKITGFFDVNAKVPWWPLALKTPNDFKKEFIAVDDAWNYRSAALQIVEKSKSNPDSEDILESLCMSDYDIQSMTAYINKLNKATLQVSDLIKTDELDFMFKDLWNTFNLDKAEKTVDDIAERYNLKNDEVEKLKNSLEQSMQASTEYKELQEQIEKKDFKKILDEYTIILKQTETLFSKHYSVPLFTSENPAFQTPDGQENANLEIRIEKSMAENNDFNLRFFILSDKVINKTQTDIFAVYPPQTDISKISQKAYNLKISNNEKNNEWEEIVPYGQDKSIVLQFEAVQWSMDKLISETLKGNIIKAKNILSYLGEKIYDSELKHDANDVKILESHLKDYETKQIPINPVKGFRQTQGYLFIIPVKDSKDDNILFYLNVGLQSGRIPSENGYGSPNEEASGRLEDVIISLNKNKIEDKGQSEQPLSEGQLKGTLAKLQGLIYTYYSDHDGKYPEKLSDIEPYYFELLVDPKTYDGPITDNLMKKVPIPKADWIYNNKTGKIKSKSHPEWGD